MEPMTHAESITVAAPPSEVYSVVSDVTRTGEWSPVCRECWWDEGDGPWVGSFFTGRNVNEERTWETRCEVIAADEGRRFGWSVAGGLVHWTYTMSPVEGGPERTELTESWEFTVAGQEAFAERFGDQADAEIEKRRQAAYDGIPATLAAIKQVIEGS